jgi:hypothetical protein
MNPFLQELFTVLEGCTWVEKLPPIRKRIGRKIDDAHDQGLSQVKLKARSLPDQRGHDQEGAWITSPC